MTPRQISARSGPSSGTTDSHPQALVGLVSLLVAGGVGLAIVVGPPDPAHLRIPQGLHDLDVLARSANPPLDGVLQIAVLTAWLVWAWAVASVVVELALRLAEAGPARGADWLRRARALADRLTMPLARRAVAAAILVQVTARPALPSIAFAEVQSPAALVSPSTLHTELGNRFAPLQAQGEPDQAQRPDVLQYRVKRGDTLWSIAERYYGTGEEFDRLIDANAGRRMPDGRVFDRAGLIYPDWVLDIPLPPPVIEEHDGVRWYVVRRGDTLRGIASQVLGNEYRFQELFDLNVGARLTDNGPTLRDPNLIWPALRLQLPEDQPTLESDVTQKPPLDASAQTQPANATAPDKASPVEPTSSATPVPPLPTQEPSPLAADQQIAAVTTMPTSTVENVPVSPKIEEPSTAAQPSSDLPLTVVAVATLSAAVLATGGVLIRRRHGRRVRNAEAVEPEVRLDDGFALIDPGRDLASRRAGGGYEAEQIASRLSRAYAAILSDRLPESERNHVFGHVELVALRHGRKSTTFVLSAPPSARPPLVEHVEAAAERAFGNEVDIEALISHEGDVLVRLSRISNKQPLLELVEPARPAVEELWPEPLLLPLGLLFDRQMLLVNFGALGNVLIAAPIGEGGQVLLAAVVASLAARCRPAELSFVTFAHSGTLPIELSQLPHQLIPAVDPDDGEAVRTSLEQLRLELDRRAAGPNAVDSRIVVIVRELALMRKDERALLGPIVTAGPRHGIHVLAATSGSITELVESCPLLSEFGTRLVLQVPDEDASVALLGTPGAEELAAGGNLLLRLEHRTPVGAHGFRVAPDHLARLLTLMRDETEAERVSAPTSSTDVQVTINGDTPAPEMEWNQAGTNGNLDDGSDGSNATPLPSDKDIGDINDDGAAEPQPDANCQAAVDPVWVPTTPTNADEAAAEDNLSAAPAVDGEPPRSDLLRKLDKAALRVRCFGARGVWYGERRIWPSPEAVQETGWELLLLLAVHRISGVQAETLADILWEEDGAVNPGSTLRKRRRRLRLELKKLVPDLHGDPMPTDPKGKVYTLDPCVIASDVHKFLELAAWARGLPRRDAIAAYEEALGLYGGDLLESLDVPLYAWLYDGASIATTLRPDYRRVHDEIRRQLAELCAEGSDEPELRRAQELYTELTGERPDDDHLWVALLKVQGRLGDLMGVQASVRRLRMALVELGQGENPDKVSIPPKVQRVLEEIQTQSKAVA